ncbi:uncharacterized protein LOC126916829 isoform X1 [Bombus affinis]|uniref:Uncharacterized protein LOC100652223 isoform X1 n=1 Tax=Bombus terrestris TaxID=30195 RepID=A0A9B0BYS8_BOMTE|nr:uncharacterized protein LOC100652223 isoform X1 [Bombus terrestris]XP_050578995.1 uncharacterized protein LOC126916829 isoform X1 [Bombus affinis]
MWLIRNSNLTMRRLVNLAMLLCYLSRSVAAMYCYPDYCQNVTKLVATPGFQCLLTKVQRKGDCTKLTFEDYSHYPADGTAAKFNLRSYTYEESGYKLTAFNLSVTNVDFHGLVTRYQSLLDENESACRYIELYGNETNPVPQELYISCPFSDVSYESVPYRLDYLVIGEKYKYRKRYIFNVPVHRFIGEGVSIKEYRPFVYIDVSYAPLLSLHVQPLPEVYNVTGYKIWLINNNTDFVKTFNMTSEQDFHYNFTAHTGVFYFKVAPMHSECGDYGCVNSTTPFIIIQETSHRLLIMIISTVWIPPVILYVLYHLYKLYKRGVLKRRGIPKCLLVYSPTRLSHINVMIELAKYLRICDVNAMIDMLDVTDTTDKDPECWCDAAFRNADVVLIATSPPPKKPAASAIYRNTGNYLLRLVKENQSEKEKRYYIVQLPYCKSDDVPEETRHLRRLSLPKELPKLVKIIHKVERVKCSSVSDQEFLDSVKLAKLEILKEDANIAKDERETENLLTSERTETANNRTSTVLDNNAVSQSFATNIDELNLLGEGGEGEEVCTRESSKDDTCSFRIDELNL